MNLIQTPLKDLVILEPKVHHDDRGWFMESYNKETLAKLGITMEFIQDNHSYSKQKGVLRGLHFQNDPFAQTKLVRCTQGSILDVAVDLRKGSKTYGQWFSVELTETNAKQLLIPKGFAHGFVVLSEGAEVQYKVDCLYDKACDRGIRYDDPALGIVWPDFKMLVSEKDAKAPLLKDSDVNFITEKESV